VTMRTGSILVADDDASMRTVLSQALARAGHRARVTGTASSLWQWVAAGEGEVVVTDVYMPDGTAFDLIPRIRKLRPDLPVIVMSAHSTLATAVTAAELGAFDYLAKPFDLNNLLAVIERALQAPKPASKAPTDGPIADQGPLIGRSPAMQEIYRTLARLTQTDLTVMITGESGTGKELVARALHSHSKRRNGPFVAINMAAIPRDLIEAELFGHEKGAFTGAANRGIGRFEQAEGGTLLLDEIGDMPMDAQTRLLRVLQEGEFTSVGGRTSIRANVRIVAATHRDLRQHIAHGLFREDLYYRINVVPLRLPPLRERREDIPDLVRSFLSNAAKAGLPDRTIEPAALERLMAHDWPGNVRELENVVLRLVAIHAQETISANLVAAQLKETALAPAHAAGSGEQSLSGVVEEWLRGEFSRKDGTLPPPGLYDRVLRDMEAPLLRAALVATHGNQLRAAELLGVNRNTLRKKMRDLGIQVHAEID
jgi:two-component system, NtrC family, nitrogen regulation response regulator GlnG